MQGGGEEMDWCQTEKDSKKPPNAMLQSGDWFSVAGDVDDFIFYYEHTGEEQEQQTYQSRR